ncbi:hypothetical protein V502_09931 [Pseudogymnoascus sp. VKM F-4520 (FW-2644)]|nr:hypothetical protein V502_09931 [Pseudogymnoascus sp. VKM F-4520 (FW-2644)]
MLYHISWKIYMVFGTFNGLALIHVFLAAPETKGKILEEMDEIFDSGRKAWQRQPKGSRLNDLVKRIEEGTIEPPGTHRRRPRDGLETRQHGRWEEQ